VKTNEALEVAVIIYSLYCNKNISRIKSNQLPQISLNYFLISSHVLYWTVINSEVREQ